MPNWSNRWLAGGLSTVLCASGSSWAAFTATLPTAQSEGAIAYMSGGIDSGQASAMKRAASKYSLELEFLLPGKAYPSRPAYVPVKIKDLAGHVFLDRASDGPLMLVQLPVGRYIVTALNAGKSETARVRIASGERSTLAFDWKG